MKLRNIILCMYEDIISGNIISILIRTHTYNLLVIDGYTTREDLVKFLNSYGNKKVTSIEESTEYSNEYYVTVVGY